MRNEKTANLASPLIQLNSQEGIQMKIETEYRLTMTSSYSIEEERNPAENIKHVPYSVRYWEYGYRKVYEFVEKFGTRSFRTMNKQSLAILLSNHDDKTYALEFLDFFDTTNKKELLYVIRYGIDQNILREAMERFIRLCPEEDEVVEAYKLNPFKRRDWHSRIDIIEKLRIESLSLEEYKFLRKEEKLLG